eukprot:403353250
MMMFIIVLNQVIDDPENNKTFDADIVNSVKTCDQDQECASYQICDSDSHSCIHKGIFPVKGVEIGGLITISILMTLCTVAGIGGGGDLVPLLMSFFEFEAKEAVAISGFAIFLCAVTRYIFNFRQRHPSKDSVQIDYGLASVMMPTVFIGSFLGVLINIVFPVLYLQIALTLLLCFLFYECTKKAVVIFRKENQAQQPTLSQVQGIKVDENQITSYQNNENINEKLLTKSFTKDSKKNSKIKRSSQRASILAEDYAEYQKDATMTSINSDEIMDLNNNIEQKILENQPLVPQSPLIKFSFSTSRDLIKVDKLLAREKTHYQWDKQGICAIVLIVEVLVSLFRGSKKTKSIIDIQTCSVWDWLCFAFFIVFCFFMSMVAVNNLKKQQQLKMKSGRGLHPSDIKFEGKKVTKLILVSSIGGLVSGAFGIGGGTIYNPLLLSMGAPPSVASSTGMYMVMFSNFGSSITYIVYGTLNVKFGFWIGGFCCASSILGLFLLNKIVKKLNRQSPIVIILAVVMGISALLVPIFGSIDMVKQVRDGQSITQFSSLC